jgi:hypothetical protein
MGANRKEKKRKRKRKRKGLVYLGGMRSGPDITLESNLIVLKKDV